jgi:hypothetical protein
MESRPVSHRGVLHALHSVGIPIVITSFLFLHALGLAGLRELILRAPPPPPAAAPGRSFYSNFDWLDYGLILLVN